MLISSITAIPPGRLRRVATPMMVLYLLAFIPFQLIGDSAEMIRLQLAGSETQARGIISAWSPSEVVDMAYLQGFDAVHPLIYGLLLATAGVWAGRQHPGRSVRWTRIAVGGAVAAAIFDTIENVGMIMMIRGETNAPIPSVTTTFAVAKFLTILSVLAYVALGAAARLRDKGPKLVNG